METGVKDRINRRYSDFLTSVDPLNVPQSGNDDNSLWIKIDLHCHDYNSSRPSNPVGRLMNAPESWLSTEDLIKRLVDNGMNAFTVTNHNNGKSCFSMQDKGHDILTGGEFDCFFPEERIHTHVLTYGFTPDMEEKLNLYKKNIYKFLDYAMENDLSVHLAHPLFWGNKLKHYSSGILEKAALLFNSFEVINGQRDSYHNLLTALWVRSLTVEKLEDLSKKTGIKPERFCSRDPYRKSMIGGSDDHIGFYAGSSYTWVKVNAEEYENGRIPLSKLVLKSLKSGETLPYGPHSNSTKLEVALLDYFFQVNMNLKDPGLFRMLLHKGSSVQKMQALAIVNAVKELKRHKYTSMFMEMFHNAFHGKKVPLIRQWAASERSKPLIKEVQKIAEAVKKNSGDYSDVAEKSVNNMYNYLYGYLIKRIVHHLKESKFSEMEYSKSMELILEGFELPSAIRSWSEPESHHGSEGNLSIGKIFDDLTFPVLAMTIFGGAKYASQFSMNENRLFIKEFAEKEGLFRSEGRVLWLTDTFEEKNGVSVSLHSYLKEIRENDLPVDILCCSDKLENEPNLIVIKPLEKIELPFYKDQTLRIPDFIEIQNIMEKGGYDKIVCSTELFMGLIALYLKGAFSVPVYFFLHTDWIEFFKTSLKTSSFLLGRFKRVLRWFYRSFDGIFVLNSQNEKWLTGDRMKIPQNRVHRIKHWVDTSVFKKYNDKPHFLDSWIDPDVPTIMFAGRLSKEKGVMDLPVIYDELKRRNIKCNFIIAGKGPLSEWVEENFTEAYYLGWAEQHTLAKLYSHVKLLILPSMFDTFGRVVLEAMSCGCPVISYNARGPKDIIEDKKSGFLVKNIDEMKKEIAEYLKKPDLYRVMSEAALDRSKEFNRDIIINKFLSVLDINSHKNIKNRPEQSISVVEN